MKRLRLSGLGCFGVLALLALPVAAADAPSDQAAQSASETQTPAPEPPPAATSPAPAPPSQLQAADHPWDAGETLDLHWEPSPDVGAGRVDHYELLRRELPDGDWELIERVRPSASFSTVSGVHPGKQYLFRLVAVSPEGASAPAIETSDPISPSIQWFDGNRFWFMVTLVIFCGSVVFFIRKARGGEPLKVRKIAGLEAVDEAVGRATEMGRPCLFIPGIQDMNDIQTIAGINVLARVSKTAAEYDARVEVPTSRSLVMTAARETVHSSYLAAGRPDAFNEDMIYYVTDEQFGYVAYCQGMMTREKPAACFYMGAFFAESLILAETGNSVGAIQVAGTAMPAQLPFFVAACDYTLIGEEFFAASAYLSGSPEELGSLKGQDVGKVLVAAGIVVGVAVATLAELTGSELFARVLTFIKSTMLT